MCQVSGHSCHVANERVGDCGSGIGQDWIFGTYQLRSFQVRFSCERANLEKTIGFSDVSQLRDTVDINDVARRGQTELHQRNQTHPSRKNLRLSSMLLQ